MLAGQVKAAEEGGRSGCRQGRARPDQGRHGRGRRVVRRRAPAGLERGRHRRRHRSRAQERIRRRHRASRPPDARCDRRRPQRRRRQRQRLRRGDGDRRGRGRPAAQALGRLRPLRRRGERPARLAALPVRLPHSPRQDRGQRGPGHDRPHGQGQRGRPGPLCPGHRHDHPRVQEAADRGQRAHRPLAAQVRPPRRRRLGQHDLRQLRHPRRLLLLGLAPGLPPGHGRRREDRLRQSRGAGPPLLRADGRAGR